MEFILPPLLLLYYTRPKTFKTAGSPGTVTYIGLMCKLTTSPKATPLFNMSDYCDYNAISTCKVHKSKVGINCCDTDTT